MINNLVIDPSFGFHLKKIVETIPLAKRRALSREIKAMAILLSLDADALLADQRAKWRQDPTRPRFKPKARQPLSTYQLKWRISGQELNLPLEEAAQILGWTPGSLRQRVSFNGVVHRPLSDPKTFYVDIVEIRRVDRFGEVAYTGDKPRQLMATNCNT